MRLALLLVLGVLVLAVTLASSAVGGIVYVVARGPVRGHVPSC